MALSRRSFLLGIAIGAFALAPPASAQFAPAVPPSHFSSVSVDVGPLHARGLGPYADFLGSVLLTETRRAFADRLGRGGPRLVVRITGIYLSSYSGGGGGGRRGGGGSSQSDYLEGEALVVGSRGEILARYPQVSTTAAASSGAWYDPHIDQRRTAYLAQHYAAWLRRRIG